MPETTLARPARATAPISPELPRRRGTETLTLITRCVRLTRRDTEAAITAIALPVMIMLLFVYLFGGAINTGTAYVTYVVPGVLLLCVGFGAGSTAMSVSRDMSSGVADRFRSMDVSTSSLLAGQVVASLARNAVATALVVLIAIPIGFRPHAGPLQWLAAAGVLGLWVLALSWLSAALGVLVKSPEATSGFTFYLSFLAYPSSAFVPIATMPTWLRGFARNQPITHVVESLRGLQLDQPLGAHVAWAIGWSLGIVTASVLLASLAHRHRTR